MIVTRYIGYGWENLVTVMFGDGNVWRKWMDEDFGEKSLTNRSVIRLLIVTTNLDGFSLANC